MLFEILDIFDDFCCRHENFALFSLSCLIVFVFLLLIALGPITGIFLIIVFIGIALALPIIFVVITIKVILNKKEVK